MSIVELPTKTNLQITDIDAGTSSQRHLHPELFDRVVARLVNREGFDGEIAVRAVDQAWTFMLLCSRRTSPEGPLTPTKIVDEAWHATILFTRQYAELCSILGVEGIIHHEPADTPTTRGAEQCRATVRAFQDHGISYDPELWEIPVRLSGGASECIPDTCSGTCKCTPSPAY